jgi:hypothetical protein
MEYAEEFAENVVEVATYMNAGSIILSTLVADEGKIFENIGRSFFRVNCIAVVIATTLTVVNKVNKRRMNKRMCHGHSCLFPMITTPYDANG